MRMAFGIHAVDAKPADGDLIAGLRLAMVPP